MSTSHRISTSIIVALMAALLAGAQAQGVHYSTGFETSADTAGWVLLNGTQSNRWCIGRTTAHGGHSGLYVSYDNGLSNACTSSASVVYAYYQFSLIGSVCDIAFDWKCVGNGIFDFMRVFVVTDTVTILPDTWPWGINYSSTFGSTPPPAGWIDLGNGRMNHQLLWQRFDTTLSLSPGAYKLLFVWSNSGVAAQPPAAIDDVVIDEPSCPIPLKLTFSDITPDSTTISWHDRGSARGYYVEYADSAFLPGLGFGNQRYVYDTMVGLGRLVPNRQYHVYVRSDCGTAISPFTHDIFSTICQGAALPLTEDFETWPQGTREAAIGPCWHRSMPASGSADYYPCVVVNMAHSGGKSIRFHSSNTDYLALPYTNIPLRTLTLSFWVYKAGMDNPHVVHVGVMTDPDNAGTFTPVQTVSPSVDNQWEHFEIPLASYTGNGRYVALMSPHNGTYIDDILLDVTPACLHPMNLTFEWVTQDSCTLSWHRRGTATRWAVEYSAMSILPGSGMGRVIYVNDTVCTLTGLIPDTTYHVYVHSICGSDTSLNIEGTFRTLCPGAALPISEDFSSYNIGALNLGPSSCWRSGTNYYDNYNYIFPPTVASANNAQSAGNSLSLYTVSGRYTYIALPPANAPVNRLTLSFWIYKNTTDTAELLQAGVMDNPGDAATFTPVRNIVPTGLRTWKYVEVPLSTYSGRGRCVALMVPQASGDFRSYIDDITLDYTPACTLPTNFRVASTTPISATLKWTSCPNRTVSLIEYGPSGFTCGTGTVVTSTVDSITVTGLTPTASYDFYLRDVCGTDSSSVTDALSAQPGVWVTRANHIDTVMLCGGVLYDDGGARNSYSDNQRSTVVLMPAYQGSMVYVDGTHSIQRGEKLYFYDGVGTNAAILDSIVPAQFSYNVPLGPYRATNPAGALTVLFTSDSYGNTYGYALNVWCGSPTPCLTPADLRVSGIAWSGAIVSWGDTGTFEVSCKTATSIIWPASVTVTDTFYCYTWLNPNTQYEWRVRRICTGINYCDTGDWAYSSFTTGSCEKPTGLDASGITSSSAVVSWHGIGNFVLSYKDSSASAWTTVQRVPATSYLITGLNPATRYDWRVKTVCNDVNFSSWATGTFVTGTETEGIREKPSDAFAVTIRPNPAIRGGHVEVAVKGIEGTVTIVLMDVTGRTLQSTATYSAVHPARLDMGGVSRGTYFVKVTASDRTEVRKLIVR